MAPNLLARETSPYLLQHADNPVDWRPWGPEALAAAQAENKPILLSIGYAACHWCHVMAHESFEDERIAELMNQRFVNIKVDREERPDLDTIYQAALAMLGQQGGWPLTMFLTPAGEPFWGGTYFPPEARYGRPGFPEVLNTLSEIYRREPDKVGSNVAALRDALARLGDNQTGGPIDLALLDPIARRFATEIDPVHGGIGGPPKFPQVSILLLMWRGYLRTGDVALRDAVLLTLTAMCQGGIYDHLGGGFSRYSVDREWLVPHFEKMLYDNAQLVDLLALVWQDTRNPLYEVRLRETVGWVLREMIAEGGAFAATLDADSEGEEGRFYVWTEDQIDRLLGADAPLFKACYDVGPEGNWEGHTILNRRGQATLADPATELKLAELRGILWRDRERRIRPGWDDKVLADWNGLMIAALANAGMVFDEPEWIAAATRAFAFIRDRVTRDGRLGHGWRGGRLTWPASLDDFANMARAALVLFEATGDPACLAQARSWIEQLDRHYWDAERGGYFFTADDAEALIVRTKSVHDNAVPAGNGTIAGVLAALYHLTGETAYRERAEAVIAAFSGELERSFFALATLLNSAELLVRAVQIVIIGDRDAPDTRALARAVLDRALPNRLLVIVPPGTALPPGHPAAGKAQIERRPTAYVCTGMTCRAPVTDPAALGAALDRPALDQPR